MASAQAAPATSPLPIESGGTTRPPPLCRLRPHTTVGSMFSAITERSNASIPLQAGACGKPPFPNPPPPISRRPSSPTASCMPLGWMASCLSPKSKTTSSSWPKTPWASHSPPRQWRFPTASSSAAIATSFASRTRIRPRHPKPGLPPPPAPSRPPTHHEFTFFVHTMPRRRSITFPKIPKKNLDTERHKAQTAPGW